MSPRNPQLNEVIRDKTRRQLMSSALELFATHGYASTSISRIAKQAGVSKGLMYNYFESKQALLLAIVEDLASIGQELLDNHEEEPAPERLRRLINGSLEFFRHQRPLVRLMMQLALQQEAMADLKPFMDTIKQTQINKLMDIMKGLGCEDPEAEAYFFGACMDGMGIGLLAMGDEYPLNNVLNLLMKRYKIPL